MMRDDKPFPQNWFANYKEKAAERRKLVAEAYQKELQDISKTFNEDTLKMAEEIWVLRRQLRSAQLDKAREYSWRD